MVWRQELQMTGFRIPAYHTIYLALILVAAFFLHSCFRHFVLFLHAVSICGAAVCSSWGSEGHPLQRSSSTPMEDDADFLHGRRDRTRVQVLGLWMSLDVSWVQNSCHETSRTSKVYQSVHVLWCHLFILFHTCLRLDAIDHVLLKKKQADDTLVPAEL